MFLSLTCQSGLETLLRHESVKLGLENIRVHERVLTGEGDVHVLMCLAMSSHFANRVYITYHASQKVRDFDTLFSVLSDLPLTDILPRSVQLFVDAVSIRSTLTSIPHIQRIGEKGLHATGNFSAHPESPEIHILLFLREDELDVMIDVTGDPLHKRGYRRESGEAPLKESLAAGIVALSGWNYRMPFWDPCCGSGTIAIEAMLLAQNRAPNLHRHFRFESMPFYKTEVHEAARRFLEAREYTREYLLYASDCDAALVEIAKKNAQWAGIGEHIRFFVSDVREPFPYMSQIPFIVTNPPYGKRMNPHDLRGIYDALDTKITTGSGGGYISSYFSESSRKGWKNRKLLNGGEPCRLWFYTGERSL